MGVSYYQCSAETLFYLWLQYKLKEPVNQEIIFSYESYQVQLQILALYITSYGGETNMKNIRDSINEQQYTE